MTLNLHNGGDAAERIVHRPTSHEIRRAAALKLRVDQRQRFRMLANRLYYSRFYLFYYIVMIVANMAAVTWICVARGYPDHVGFAVLEVAINALLVVEVTIKLLASGRRFWRTWTNKFDFFIMVLCVTSLLAYFGAQPSEAEEIEDLVATVLLIFRCCLQGFRLLWLLKNRRLALQKQADVDFSILGEPDSTCGGEDEDDDDGMSTHGAFGRAFLELAGIRRGPLSASPRSDDGLRGGGSFDESDNDSPIFGRGCSHLDSAEVIARFHDAFAAGDERLGSAAEVAEEEEEEAQGGSADTAIGESAADAEAEQCFGAGCTGVLVAEHAEVAADAADAAAASVLLTANTTTTTTSLALAV